MLFSPQTFYSLSFLIAANLLILFQIDTSGLRFVKTDRCIIKFPPKLHTKPCHCFMHYWGIWICYNLEQGGGGRGRQRGWIADFRLKRLCDLEMIVLIACCLVECKLASEGGLDLCAHPWGLIVPQISWKSAVEGTIESWGLALPSINHLLKEKTEG